MRSLLEAQAESRVERAASHWWSLPMSQVGRIVEHALAEDLGRGDLTTALTVERGTYAVATLVAKDNGIVSGMGVAQMVFAQLEDHAAWDSRVRDGEAVTRGESLATVRGPATHILSGERVALNLIQRMSGIATLTKTFVDAVGHTNTRIVDTRKTAPGLRILDKYAVVCGGGHNHRRGLDDGILIKDNHISACGGIGQAVTRARDGAPQGLKIEVEVEQIDQIEKAIEAGAEVLLLDNMDTGALARAVSLVAGRVETEASGGVSLTTVTSVAQSGVDYISVGALTHSVHALDISLELRLML